MFGYRYDTETGLYYLQSRYYNPDWGRFLNADSYIGTPGELLSCNMFAYCSNNPVNRDDPNGGSWGALAAGVGAVLALPAEVAAVVTVGAVVLVTAVVYCVGDVAVQEYRNHHVSYSDSSTSGTADTSNPQPIQTKPQSGRAKNKLKPDTNAQGDHTTFKRDPETGEITNYETWNVNPRNPRTGFSSEKRYDGIGEPHFNKVTKERLLPHVHDKMVPGEVRSPIPWEGPIKR